MVGLERADCCDFKAVARIERSPFVFAWFVASGRALACHAPGLD